VSRKKKATKKAARKPRPRVSQEPEWGPPMKIGNIGRRIVEIREPLNEAAIQSIGELEAVALTTAVRAGQLDADLTKLEALVKKLQSDLDLHGRLARVEAALDLLE